MFKNFLSSLLKKYSLSQNPRIKALKKKLKSNPKDSTLLFELAEVYYGEHSQTDGIWEKAKKLIMKAISIDVESIRFFRLTTHGIGGGRSVTYVLPGYEDDDTEQILDGFSFYSFCLNTLLQFLIESDRVNIIFDMKNVAFFGELGDAILFDMKKKCMAKRGDLQCIRVPKDIKKVGEIMEWWPEYFGFYDSEKEALDYYENLSYTDPPKDLDLPTNVLGG